VLQTASKLKTQVLLVEDDAATASTLRKALESLGYQVWWAEDGAHAKALLEQASQATANPDLIVLDLMLPDIDGLVLCTELRSIVDVPIIICSARTGLTDRVLSLKLGADAFIAKPFDLEEFTASVEAVLRRVPGPGGHPPRPGSGEIRLGALLIRVAARAVTLSDRPVNLTAIEYRLLLALATRPDVVLSWQQLGQQVWGYHDKDIRNVIQVHIGRLRKKLARGAGPAPVIVPVRSVGYRLQSSTPSPAR
jgi:two-component system response regulator MtrA